MISPLHYTLNRGANRGQILPRIASAVRRVWRAGAPGFRRGAVFDDSGVPGAPGDASSSIVNIKSVDINHIATIGNIAYNTILRV